MRKMKITKEESEKTPYRDAFACDTKATRAQRSKKFPLPRKPVITRLRNAYIPSISLRSEAITLLSCDPCRIRRAIVHSQFSKILPSPAEERRGDIFLSSDNHLTKKVDTCLNLAEMNGWVESRGPAKRRHDPRGTQSARREINNPPFLMPRYRASSRLYNAADPHTSDVIVVSRTTSS